jgi:hypothetical protein
LAVGGIAALAWAQEKKPTEPKPGEPKKAEESKKAEPGKGAAEADPMMEAYMKAAMPGKEHEVLKLMAGSWVAKSKFRMAPDQPWEESTGTSERKLIMDGRFLQTELKSPPADEGMPPYDGLSITGYDNTLKKYFNTWVDNMGSGVMISYGTADATGKVITYTSEYPDPMTGKVKKYRTVTRLKDDKTEVFEM